MRTLTTMQVQCVQQQEGLKEEKIHSTYFSICNCDKLSLLLLLLFFLFCYLGIFFCFAKVFGLIFLMQQIDIIYIYLYTIFFLQGYIFCFLYFSFAVSFLFLFLFLVFCDFFKMHWFLIDYFFFFNQSAKHSVYFPKVQE